MEWNGMESINQSINQSISVGGLERDDETDAGIKRDIVVSSWVGRSISLSASARTASLSFGLVRLVFSQSYYISVVQENPKTRGILQMEYGN